MIRIDLFLKLSRLVKRRTIAQEMVEIGAVRINERSINAASPVQRGDIVDVAYATRLVRIRVLEDDEPRLRRAGSIAFEVIEERKVDPAMRPW